MLDEFINSGVATNLHHLNRYLKFMESVPEQERGESHHILPKSLFPQYQLKSIAPWNQKLISPRAHFIAHWMLTKALPNNNSMTRAFWAMTHNTNDRTYRVSSKIYELARVQFSESMMGESHPMFGVKHSEETRLRMRESAKAFYENLSPELREQRRLERSLEWTDEMRANKSADLKRYIKENGDRLNSEEALKKRVERQSRKFKVVDPSGVEYIGCNLKEFCRQNNLTPGNMSAVCRGDRPNHKGWTGKYLPE